MTVRTETGLPRLRGSDSRLAQALPSLVVAFVTLIIWQLGASRLVGQVASPTQIVQQVIADRDLLMASMLSTVGVAGRGWLIAAVLAVAIAVVFVQLPGVERSLQRVAVVLYCVPIVAVAPVLQVVMPGDLPQVTVSVIAVFFQMLVLTSLGFRAADPGAKAIVRSEGGGPLKELWFVGLRSALPSIMTGLRLGVPAAFVGALVGEFIGAQRGLGVLLVQALSTYETERVWAVAVVIAVVSGGLYAIIAWLGRILSPWEGKGPSPLALGEPTLMLSRGRRFLGAAISLVVSVLVLSVIWIGGIRLFQLSAYFAKTPGDLVFDFFISPEASVRRGIIAPALLDSVLDSGLGYVTGIALGIGVALVFTAIPKVGRAFSPIILTINAIPIIVVLPLVITVLGRGFATTVAVAALVSFFPVLVNTRQGMASTPKPLLDLYRSISAPPLTVLFRVRLPHAVPHILAAARICIPIAVTGALLAEWLATGRGLGYLIFSAGAEAQYSVVWGASALLTMVALVAYFIVTTLERAALRRYAP